MVVAGDGVEVAQPQPVFNALLAFQADEGDGLVIGQRLLPLAAQLAHLHHGQVGLQGLVERGARQGAAIEAQGHLLVPGPAVAAHVVGDRAYGVHRVAPDVPFAVLVEVHCVAAVAAGHELAQAHGAGIGAHKPVGGMAVLAGEEDKLAELLLEEGAAGRVVEG